MMQYRLTIVWEERETGRFYQCIKMVLDVNIGKVTQRVLCRLTYVPLLVWDDIIMIVIVEIDRTRLKTIAMYFWYTNCEHPIFYLNYIWARIFIHFVFNFEREELPGYGNGHLQTRLKFNVLAWMQCGPILDITYGGWNFERAKL